VTKTLASDMPLIHHQLSLEEIGSEKLFGLNQQPKSSLNRVACGTEQTAVHAPRSELKDGSPVMSIGLQAHKRASQPKHHSSQCVCMFSSYVHPKSSHTSLQKSYAVVLSTQPHVAPSYKMVPAFTASLSEQRLLRISAPIPSSFGHSSDSNTW